MPKYQTYGDYDPERDDYVETAEKEVRGGDILRANEEQATKSEPKKGFYKKDSDTAVAANKREGAVSNAASGLYAGLNGAESKSRSGRFTKRFAPLVFILGVTGAGAIGIGFSQVMMPFHVIESLTEMTDGSFTARSARMPSLVKWMFNMETETGFTQKTGFLNEALTGTKYRYRRNIESTKTKQRLAAEGIEVDTSGSKTVLKYKQADGTVRTVTADEYSELWRNDSDFRNRMNRGGRSFLGRIAAHIDLTLANFLNSHNLTKNLFEGWINKVYDAEGQTARLHTVIEEKKSSRLGDVDAGTGKSDVDDDGTVKNVSQFDGDEGTEKIRPKTDTDVDLRNKYADMISNVANVTTSAVCGAAAVASAVTAAKLVIAYSNARGTFSAQAEAVDKVKAGQGDSSPINAVADDMMARDENGLTMLQSEQMKWALSGGHYTPNKNAEDVVNNSQDAMLSGSGGFFAGLEGFWNSFGTIGSSTKWIIGCAAANVATAAVSIVANIATAGMFSFGKFALTVAAGTAISIGTSKLVSMLVENAKSDFCLDTKGVSRGACVYLGASNYNGTNFQNGGGTLATKEKAEEFYDSYKIALQDEAEYIRNTKSPFDTSSSHTFLGSIVSKLGMLAIEMPSTIGMLGGLANIAATSINSLLPTASALDKTSFFDNQLRDDCANLDFGDFVALGDTNCEAWYVTDQSMNKIDPEETFAKLVEYGSFEMVDAETVKTDEKTGMEIINPSSDLAKYISYCAYRSSPFGTVDQNIMDTEASLIKPDGNTDSIAAKLKNLLSQILDAIPIIGDFIQGIRGVSQIAVLGWSTGANCVARGSSVDSQLSGVTIDGTGETSGAVSLKSWDNFMKYAQSYVADDRYMQTVDEKYVSPVQEYAKKQGILLSDNELPFVEYLAKYSGYTVENMQIALNEIEYWTYVAQYEPEGKGPVVFEEPSEVYDFELPSREIYEDYEERVAAIGQHVVYADLRNRYSAVT
ncbi:hypothetical protein IKG48_03215 [Candidatus Saccharibacteria bacterium]|nr:hypothetical protein [Candidatus Saccharibacteria bacterium]